MTHHHTEIEALGYLFLAAIAATVCFLIVREIVIACVPELRRRNRRALWPL